MANVYITGSSRGIGLELARHYLMAGNRVFASCRTPAKADALQKLAAGSGGKLTVHALDVGDPESIKKAAREIGDIPVHLLINNAGVLGGTYEEQMLAGIDFDKFREAIEVMTFGPVRMVQAFLDKLERANGAKVVTITSQLGASTWPTPGLLPYSAAKAASNRLVRGIAMELTPKNIILIAMHPGYVQTDMAGPNADITPEASATGIAKVAAGLKPEDAGKFLKWNGEIHPW
jgi:NAD(P)-dependent dehydrogenase (short-subunit alcohol dehydrogenase family)